MNTRLLMELRVEVGVAQEIGVARTGCSFERTAYSNSISAPHSGPTTAR